MGGDRSIGSVRLVRRWRAKLTARAPSALPASLPTRTPSNMDSTPPDQNNIPPSQPDSQQPSEAHTPSGGEVETHDRQPSSSSSSSHPPAAPSSGAPLPTPNVSDGSAAQAPPRQLLPRAQQGQLQLRAGQGARPAPPGSVASSSSSLRTATTTTQNRPPGHAPSGTAAQTAQAAQEAALLQITFPGLREGIDPFKCTGCMWLWTEKTALKAQNNMCKSRIRL